MFDPLTARARATPDGEALVAAETGDSWTYAQLTAEAGEAAARLRGLGVAAADHVGVVMEPSPTYVGLVHAIARLGAVLVPLGHDLTAREVADRVERADVTTLVCDADTEQLAVEATEQADVPVVTVDAPHWERVASLGDGDPTADGPVLDVPSGRPASSRADDGPGGPNADGPMVEARPKPNRRVEDATDAAGRVGGDAAADVDVPPHPPADWRHDERFCIMFTSGTTGRPKAVELTLGNVLASAVASAFRLGVTPDDRWLVTLSLHHMGGLAPLYRSALYGSTVVLREGFEAGPAADDLAEYDCTAVSVVPTMLRRMLSARGTLTDSLRFVLLGGAPASDALLERCQDFSVPVAATYGMTETASQIATARPREAFDRSGTVGRPLLWTTVTVVGDDGEPVARGQTGELVVAGPTVTPSYYRDPEATAAAFGEYGLHTGDVGYRTSEGYVHVLNRKDDRIITGGENVDPGEVVDALRSFPGVEDAAVVGLDDPEWGERVAALVVADDIDREALDGHLRERLAPYKLPKSLAVADEVPRTVSGTVDREAVRERLLEEVAIEDAEGGFRFGATITEQADDDETDIGSGEDADGTGITDSTETTDDPGGSDPAADGTDPD
ncbi:MAG: class I adenylate-forming enzyme family protein [Halolamina sp.]